MESDQKLNNLRHTCEHVLHTALQELYPTLKKVMGPPIDEGFYCDFDLDQKLTPADFEKIEAVMREIISDDLTLTMKEVTADQAKELFASNQYKLDTLAEIIVRGDPITVCEMQKPGSNHYDLDLCRGGHLASTGQIGAFKLSHTAGAYYKGSEKNKMLQRIYATAFETQKELDDYLAQIEEAKKRDHRKLGHQLELFTFSDMVGPGLTLWLPNGAIIREELENWAKETEAGLGYVRVATPHIGKHTLYETSGHLPYYKDDMYSAIDIEGEAYYLKGMNCPHHHMIYKARPRSYKELPLKLAEYGMVYRFEQSGALFGLMRVRAICQNDAHIYCTLDQAEEEFLKVLKLHEYYYNTLGLTKKDYYIAFGLPDPAKTTKYHGDKAIWAKAEQLMRSACKTSGIETIDDVGGAAFYGPKTDFNIKSSVGREFSISTNQLDLFMPTRFELDYTDQTGANQLCAVIHRAPLGSHERFIGFLIEHFGGAFPAWLAPVQAVIIPIGENHTEYANSVTKTLLAQGIRVQVNTKNETMQAKIRDAQTQKVPYMLIVGDAEVKTNDVSLRLRSGESLGKVSLDAAVSRIKEKIASKALDL